MGKQEFSDNTHMKSQSSKFETQTSINEQSDGQQNEQQDDETTTLRAYNYNGQSNSTNITIATVILKCPTEASLCKNKSQNKGLKPKPIYKKTSAASHIIEGDHRLVLSKAEQKAIKRRILKNLFVFSISFLLVFSAANAINNLQSSVNSKGELGVYILVTISVSFTFSCLFLPSILAKYGGFKWPMVVSEISMGLFVLANLFPYEFVLLPAAALFGVATSVLWTFQGSIISHLATEYAMYSKRKLDNVLIRFFGIFYFIYLTNHIIGNVISAIIFNYYTDISNATNISLSYCGSNDCPRTETEIPRPNEKIWNLLVSIMLGFCILGTLIIALFFNNIKPTKDDKNWLETAFETLKIFRDIKKILLLPVYAFSISLSAFIIVDITKSYITCAYGRQAIGYWFATWGLASAVSSVMAGSLTKYVRKTVVLIFTTLASMLILGFLYFWTPKQNVAAIYIIAILFGFFETTWGPVLMTLLGLLFSDNAGVAYANNRFCSSMFYLIAFGYSTVLCVKTKIYIVMSFGVLAIFSLVVFEYILDKEEKYKKVTTVEIELKIENEKSKFKPVDL